MQTTQTIRQTREIIKSWKNQGYSIGFVPTMGFLHEGHESLIKEARKNNDKVVVSIFINPTQFGPNEDFESYPRDLKRDSEICNSAGADLIFIPTASEMYHNKSYTFIDVNELTEGLCGAKRPGHFRGVCTVVSKLFNILTPNKAYFGEKDAQQLAVIKKMVVDLNFDIEIIGCPIIREPDGLAMSSRNTYLSKEERQAALILNKSLAKGRLALEEGEKNAEIIKKIIQTSIQSEVLAKIDYIEIVDSENLNPIKKLQNSILVAIAVFIGKTRLIDNFTYII